MPQVFLYRFNIVPCPEAVDGVGMAKIMESQSRFSQIFCNSFEILVENLVVDVPPKLGCEYQIVRVLPAVAESSTPRLLTLFLQLQNIYNFVSYSQNTGLVIF